jgi:hypothetical protein
MSEADGMKPEPRRRGPGPWVWAAILLFIIYPLSIGPVFRVCDAMGISFTFLMGTIYLPLMWFSVRNEASRGILYWYMFRLWGVSWPDGP